MPDWSKVAKERDLFGELGWIPNFPVKNSKNNEFRHPSYKEFFDKPRDYTKEFHIGTQSNTDLLKLAGDDPHQKSIQQLSRRSSGSLKASDSQSVFGGTRRSLNTLERMSYSAIRHSSRAVN